MTTGADPAVAAWSAFLDEMERGLEALAGQIADGQAIPAPRPFAPPAELPPLPRSLVARAAAVLDRTQAVEAEVAERAMHTAERLRALGQMQVERRPVRPAFFDQAV